MERLSCGISRMKRNNSIELLRGPKATQRHGENSKVNKCENVENNELLPGHGVKQGTFLMMQETLVDDDLFSLEIFSSSKLLFFFFFSEPDNFNGKNKENCCTTPDSESCRILSN